MRILRTGGIVTLLAGLALVGQPVVDLLYDARYHEAGGILVAIALVQIPLAAGITYDQSALAAGDSQTYCAVMATRAVAQTVAFVIGVAPAGLAGALVGMTVAAVCLRGVIVWLARRYGVWDEVHDVYSAGVVCAVAAISLGVNAETLGLLSR